MEEFVKTLSVRIIEAPDKERIRSFTDSLKDEDGIQTVEFSNQTFSINYNPYVISKNEIVHELNLMGIHREEELKERGIKKWLSNLAKQNKKNLGNQRLDCCDLNH